MIAFFFLCVWMFHTMTSGRISSAASVIRLRAPYEFQNAAWYTVSGEVGEVIEDSCERILGRYIDCWYPSTGSGACIGRQRPIRRRMTTARRRRPFPELFERAA